MDSTAIIVVLVILCLVLAFTAWRLRDLVLYQKVEINAQKANFAEKLVSIEKQLVEKNHEAAEAELKCRQAVLEFEAQTQAQAKQLAELQSQLSQQAQEAEQIRAQQAQALAEAQSQLKEKDDKTAELQQCLQEQSDANAYKQALMLTLSNSAYDALLVVDADCRIIASNSSAETLFEREKLIGEDLVDVTNAPELRMMVEDALINEEESYEEQIIIGKCNYRVHTQVIRRDGHLFIGLAVRDITQLVRLNRARRDMVANISHELRTPIANIRLIIDGLFHDQEKPKRKDTISSLRTIARETDNLLWLVQEMSDLSMIESGQAIVRMVEVTLSELIEEAVERMVDQSERYEISIVRHIPEKLRVLCDRDLAQRVLVNLIHNALKWSPREDSVTISAANDGDEITISVVDNGPGVPEDMVDRIFERFYQVDASRSRGEGSGLGLAICRHIVEAHGGRIWAESNKDGAGGRFRFTLLSAGEKLSADMNGAKNH